MARIVVLLLILAPSLARAQEVVVLPEIVCEDEPEAASDDSALPPVDGASPGVLAAGLSALFGMRDGAQREVAPTWSAGFDVSLALAPWMRIVLRRAGYGYARSLSGEHHAIGGSPGLELAGRIAERIEPYMQLGAALQVRLCGDDDWGFGVAPFAGVGLRFYATSWLSIAVEGALEVPATRSFLVGHEMFPQGSAVLQGGLAVAVHP